MRIKLVDLGRAVFFIFFLAGMTLALWFAREFSSSKSINSINNSNQELFKQIFLDFDNKPWEDSFGVAEKEIFPVYRFENKTNFSAEDEDELELMGYAFYLEGFHLERKWKALMGISPSGDVLGIKLTEMNEPMGFKQIFYDEHNFFDFYIQNKTSELKKMETPFIQGAYLLSKALDDEIRRSLDFFEENKKLFEKRHPRQKKIIQNKISDRQQEAEVFVYDPIL